MARTENDTWDLASSVGATATMVAAARAVASRSEDALIEDPFAEPLVRSVGIDFFTRLASGELNLADLDTGGPNGDSPTDMSRFGDWMAARTRFFDDFFLDATASGIRQAVILASGLDARGYRLSWPTDMVLFEIDQPDVITFKTSTLAKLRAHPTAELKTVAVDLRHDWPAALADAGFEAGRPTAWIAEGLLGYLPPDAQDRLLDQISELSPAGSRLAAEGVPAHQDRDHEEVRQRMQDSTERWRSHGFDIDFSELAFLGDRAEIVGYLAGHGWTVDAIRANDLLKRYGLATLDDELGFADVVYATATR